MRSGKHYGETLAQINKVDESYINWIYRYFYNSLSISQYSRNGRKTGSPMLFLLSPRPLGSAKGTR